jgi:hypothetical protein
MTHTLAFDFASRSFDALRERAERSPNGSPDVTQELLDNCEVPFFLLERLWRSVQEALDRGVEKQKFMGVLTDCLTFDQLERYPENKAAVVFRYSRSNSMKTCVPVFVLVSVGLSGSFAAGGARLSRSRSPRSTTHTA